MTGSERRPMTVEWMLGVAGIALILLAVVAGVVATLTNPADPIYLDTRQVEEPAAEAVKGTLAYLVMLVLQVAAGVAVIAWLWRVRGNAERLSSHTHRHSRGWVVGSWICPVVNLWFPMQIVGDVWRASDPRGRLSTLIPLWWTGFLGYPIISTSVSFVLAADPTLADRPSIAIILAIAQALNLVAAVTFAAIIIRINHRQAMPS